MRYLPQPSVWLSAKRMPSRRGRRPRRYPVSPVRRRTRGRPEEEAQVGRRHHPLRVPQAALDRTMAFRRRGRAGRYLGTTTNRGKGHRLRGHRHISNRPGDGAHRHPRRPTDLCPRRGVRHRRRSGTGGSGSNRCGTLGSTSGDSGCSASGFPSSSLRDLPEFTGSAILVPGAGAAGSDPRGNDTTTPSGPPDVEHRVEKRCDSMESRVSRSAIGSRQLLPCGQPRETDRLTATRDNAMPFRVFGPC